MLSIFPCDVDIVQVRELYFNINTEQDVQFFLEKTKNSDSNTIQAYRASMIMRQADYKHIPWNKFSYFKKGKKLLETCVAADPDNVEIRFVRYMVQSNLPLFLNYSSDIQKDKAFILKNIKTQKLPENLKSEIINNLQ